MPDRPRSPSRLRRPRRLTLSLAVLEGFADPAVDRTAVALIEGALAGEGEGWTYEAKEVMPWVLRRFGGKDVEQRWPILAEDSFPESSAPLRRAWNEARTELKIPKVPPLLPAAPDEADEEGVGGRTPS